MVLPISRNKVNLTSLQERFEVVARAATSKREEVVAKPFPTTRAFYKEASNLLHLDFSSKIPVIEQTLREFAKNVKGVFSIVSHVLLHPITAAKELQILNGNFQALEELLLKRIPIEEPEHSSLLRGPIIPFEQFNPDTNRCLSSGDSRLGMLLKDKNGNPLVVEHNGNKGKLYWVTKKEGSYDVMQDLFGRLGPVGAPDYEQHEVSRRLVQYENYFFTDAVKRSREQNVRIILDNALNIEQLLSSGNKFSLREEWNKSIKETLFKSMVGDVSPDQMDFIINNIDVGFRHLVKTKVFNPVPGITIFSKTNQAGEKAIRDLHLLGLDMINDHLKRLQENNNEPQDLLDDFTLGAAKLIGEGTYEPERVTFEASKIFFEMIGAGYFNRSNSRSNFDYIALTNPDFRQELVKALDRFKSVNLSEMIQEALENESLLKPFHSAAWASLAYQPSVLFISRNSRVVFRSLDQKEEVTELKEPELRQLIKKHNLSHPLLKIPQNTESGFPLGAYCREGLKRNGFLLEDGSLNSKEVFNPLKSDAITKVGKWQFGTGIRGCVGETFSVETLKWEALCMAYLLKKFPNMKIVGEAKQDFNIFSGKHFTVKA